MKSFLLLIVFFNIATATKLQEKYTDTITRAQSLSLQKERLAAASLLQIALAQQPADSAASKKLQYQLDRLSQLFYTEKALQNHQLGDSLKEKDNDKALYYYKQALLIEPYNLQVLLALARSHLAKAQLAQSPCEQALSYAKKAFKVNPYAKEVLLVHLQAFACLGKLEDFLLFKDKIAGKWKEKSIYILLAQAEVFFLAQKWQNMAIVLQRLKQKAAELADIYYWEARAQEERSEEALTSYQMYLEKCKKDLQLKKQFPLAPGLCSRVKAVKQKLTELKPDKV